MGGFLSYSLSADGCGIICDNSLQSSAGLIVTKIREYKVFSKI